MLRKIFSAESLCKNKLLRPYAFPTFSTNWQDSDKISWTKTMNKESTADDNTNSFYNPVTADLNKKLVGVQGQIKDWQLNFKKKTGRKPTLEDMRADVTIKPLIDSIEKQKQAMRLSINKYRIND